MSTHFPCWVLATALCSEMHAQRKADELAEEERKALEDARLKGLSDEEIDAIQKRLGHVLPVGRVEQLFG
mgnify:CR=1 FL=1